MSSYLIDQRIDAVDYNSFANRLNTVYGIPTGPYLPPASTSLEYGYNQTPLPLVSIGDPITAAKWLNLRNAIQACASHQGTSVVLPSSGHFVIGLPVIAENPPNRFDVALTAITTNRFNASGSGATQILSSSTASRSTPWSTQLFHDVEYEFGSVGNLRGFFNSGGQFRFTASLTGGSGNHTLSWATMLAASGTVIFDYTNFYNTDTVYSTFYTISGTGGEYTYPYAYPFTVNRYYIQARLQNGGQDIKFHIVFDDPYSNLPDIVNGTITSNISVRKASTLYLNTPSIPFPASVFTSNF